MSTLYMVATPIGNLGDMTYRGVEVLNMVQTVLCEDTRETGKLCGHYGIETRRESCHAQTSEEKVRALVGRMVDGEVMAYVSDAGTPCVSDPGFRLVREAVRRGVDVVAVPGASALTATMSVCGAPTTPMVWHGFVPHKKGRKTLFETIEQEGKRTHVMYESVHRIGKTLSSLAEVMPERWVVVGRELTKKFEEVVRGTAVEVKAYFETNTVKGEFCVMVGPESFTPEA